MHPEKAKDYLNVSFFSFLDGLDPKVCEALNMRQNQVALQYNQTIREYEDRATFYEEVIAKYKRLTPKSMSCLLRIYVAFKLMELTLDEIFQALSIIERDASKVWTNLTNSYPLGHFDGVVEDTYGTFLDEEAQEKIGSEILSIRKNTEKELNRVSQRLCT